MRMAKLVLGSLLTIGFGVFALPLKVTACSAVPLTPEKLSMNADAIVRATAVSYDKATDGKYHTTGLPDSTVKFRVEEVLKGENVPATLIINGY